MYFNPMTWWSDELEVIKPQLPFLLYRELEASIIRIRHLIADYNHKHKVASFEDIVCHDTFLTVYQAAAHAHALQQRKCTGKPYIEHPLKLSLWYYTLTGDLVGSNVLLCHDILEDCPLDRFNVDMLRTLLGDEGYTILLCLTDTANVTRKQKKALLYERLSQNKNRRFHLGKFLDSLDNVVGIALSEPVFGLSYRDEKKELSSYFCLNKEELTLWNDIMIEVDAILEIYNHNKITFKNDEQLLFFQRLTQH